MIRILIVDDQNTVQQVLKNSLEPEPDLTIVGTANNGKLAIEQVEKLQPDLVLMDIDMPILDGLTATRIIVERFVTTKILILSMHDEEKYLNGALQVGAKGYLLKNTPERDLVNAIRSAYQGYFQLGPGLLEKYLYKIQSKSNKDDFVQLNQLVINQFKEIDLIKNNSNTSQKKLENQLMYLENLKSKYINMETEFFILKSRINKLEKIFLRLREIFIVAALSLAIVVGYGIVVSILENR